MHTNLNREELSALSMVAARKLIPPEMAKVLCARGVVQQLLGGYRLTKKGWETLGRRRL